MSMRRRLAGHHDRKLVPVGIRHFHLTAFTDADSGRTERNEPVDFRKRAVQNETEPVPPGLRFLRRQEADPETGVVVRDRIEPREW
ncbi:hypothetical protein H074_16611 [Amycolatopsis decaplanina DSM 44594]|uniref:Uncharacterized protein n=1 Tax=Amycolatopsis decaplanina DSM 44594 TaxID=1284240 RepID=M2XFK2_9PSEU|nr:hypothetical protein H074_16611 [Amycolatopsis decaplanina DSM 44594]